MKIESQDIDRVKAQCISFERTIRQKPVTKVACIEQERGVLLTLSTDDGWETKYSDYASFASKFLPRRLVISHHQVKLLDATINFEEAKEFAADRFVPPPDAREEKVVQVCTRMQPPKLKTQHPPSYPSAARARGAHGIVTIVAEIGKDGHVYKAHVKQPGDKDLDDAAVDAAQRWLYEPGTCDGSPVAVMTNISVNFVAP